MDAQRTRAARTPGCALHPGVHGTQPTTVTFSRTLANKETALSLVQRHQLLHFDLF